MCLGECTPHLRCIEFTAFWQSGEEMATYRAYLACVGKQQTRGRCVGKQQTRVRQNPANKPRIRVHVTQHSLRIAQIVQRLPGRLALETPKTERSARLLPLPLFIERALAHHAERQMTERQLAGDDWDDHGLIFPSERGTPLDPRNLLRQFKALLITANLPEMRFHDLRHSCATPSSRRECIHAWCRRFSDIARSARR
jgi:hypothetical protein